MNTYYLKKFRKEAQRVIKARYNPSFLDDKSPYDLTEEGYHIRDTFAEGICEIKQILLIYRRDYILKLVKEEKRKKLNKQLVKL